MTGHWWPFGRKHDTEETAQLRDRLIVAETQLVLLRDIVEHPRRKRELRKDAKSYQVARDAVRADLEAHFGSRRTSEPRAVEGVGG